jgi:hypothetical protein
MRTTYKILIAGLITMFALASVSSVMAIPSDQARFDNREGSVFIETSSIVVKLNEGKPDFFIYKVGSSFAGRNKDPMFHIHFTHVAELFGDDLVVDDRDELLGGKIYNLASDTITWDLVTENTTNEIIGTQTSSILDNGATITFVYHVYLEDITVEEDINGTIVSYTVKGLEEIKFDIIVNNWNFTPGAQGLVFGVKVHELQYRHRVRIGNRVNQPETGDLINETHVFDPVRNQTHEENGFGFVDDRDRLQAYFAWTNQADIFDENGTYVETIPVVASSTSYGHDPTFGMGHEFGREFINLNLVYPNYGDGMKLVHDPVIGLPDTSGVSFGLIALIAVPTLAAAALVISRKRA